MTDLTQNLLAFTKGFIGLIPVWAPNGDEVGYMTNYADTFFYLNPPFEAHKGAHLVTKNWLFQDVAITVQQDAPAATEHGKVKITFSRDANAITLPTVGGHTLQVSPTMLAFGAALVAFLVLNRHGDK